MGVELTETEKTVIFNTKSHKILTLTHILTQHTMSLRAVFQELERESDELPERDVLESSEEETSKNKEGGSKKSKKSKKSRKRSYSSDDSKYTYDSYTHSSQSYSDS